MPYSQESRLVSLTTPLGEDKLLLAGFSGHEAISRLFSFHLDLLAEQGAIEFTDIIGKSVTISVQQSDNTKRYFNGLVSRFAQSGTDARFLHYQMEVVPWTWMLTRYANCQIFHNKTVSDILQQIFQNCGYTDFQISLSGSYSPIEYCVQYRETDFNFISRIMEQNGIFYFFKHEMGKHTMVIADSSTIHESCPGHATAGFNLAAGGLDADDVVNSWNLEQELRSGKYTLTDYNFKTPATSLLASESTIYSVGGNSNFELFDYPGEYQTRGDGTSVAKLRMQEEEAGHLLARGSGVCRAFTTGYKFELQDHPQEATNDTYVLTEIQHLASVSGNYSTDGGTGDHYSNQFTCIPLTVPFRPARLTPKPFVQGPQTAMVVGKSQDSGSGDDAPSSDGDEIWVDKYGRVVVLFPWDRKGACSCWVRVSQEWAGQGWGSITIPRVGQEVIVSFLEGDPDRPIVTGRVYNANSSVPYALPDNQTRSTFMTRSSKGGSSSTYNELRFEDKAGAEQVFVRAQFDQDNRVLHDSREWVGNNRSLMVTTDQMESVGGDVHNQVTGKVNEKIGGDWSSNVTGNVNQKAGQNISIQAGQNLYEKSGTTFAHEAGQTIHLKAGMTVVIEAGTELCLKVGGNFIDINPSGISIVGTMVMINSGGSAGSGPGSSPTDPVDPKKPDQADDGSTGTKFGSGSTAASSSAGPAAGAGGSPSSASPAGLSLPQVPKLPAIPANPLAGAEGVASGAVKQAEQTAQQITQQAAQGAQQAANEAQQAANAAQKAAQQAEQQAQQAVNEVKQEAKQAFNQANHAVNQAQQAVNQATAQGKAAAQQALSQAEQQAQQTAQAAKQAVQQAQQQAQQVQQQAQQAAAQAQQAAAQAQQQAQQAIKQGQQAAQQAEQQAKQAAAQAQQAAKQAEQQAQQAAQQVKQAASQAQQQAQQASKAAQQSASQAISQAQKGF